MTQRGFFQNVWFILLIVVLHQICFVPASGFCGEPNPRAKALPVSASDHVDRDLVQGLAQIPPPGWNLSEGVKTFTPKNLWEHIDGRAEFFLAYDMVEMIFAQYTDSSKSGEFIDVSIYAMGKPANAFGVFAAERQEDIAPANLGRQAYRLGSHVFIWKGPYYVRMVASREGPEFQKMNLEIAKKLMPLLHDQGEPLWGLQTLPGDDRVSGSEQYFRRDALGLDFMSDTYTARYRKGNVFFTVFLSRKADPSAAGDIVRRYAVYAKQFGEGIREMTRQGVAILLCDMDGTYDALFQKGDMVAGVTSIEDPKSAVDFAYDLWQRLPDRAHDKQK